MVVQFTSRQRKLELDTVTNDGDGGGVATLSAAVARLACTRRAEWCATLWLGFAALVVMFFYQLVPYVRLAPSHLDQGQGQLATQISTNQPEQQRQHRPAVMGMRNRTTSVQPAPAACLVLTAHNFVPELSTLGHVQANASLFGKNPSFGCAPGNVSFLTATFWTNVVAARQLGCDYRFMWCQPSAVVPGLQPHWCKVAALYQVMTHRAWSHLREVLLIDSDVRLGQSAWSLSRVVEALGRIPLRTITYADNSPGNATLFVEEGALVANASIITSSGYGCGFTVKGQNMNIHCSCMMLWRMDNPARRLAELWLRSGAAFEYDQNGFNNVAARMGQGRVVAVPSRALFRDVNTYGDNRKPEVIRTVSAKTNQIYRQCERFVDSNDASLRAVLPLGSEGYIAHHMRQKATQKGCVSSHALKPRNVYESALLHELLKRPWASIEELDFNRVFAQMVSARVSKNS